MLVDVIFPQNLKPLTYIVPNDDDITGYVVSAPLRNKDNFGLVVRTYSGNEEGYKSVSKIYSRFADKNLVSLILWASDYYLHTAGNALMSTQFKDYILSTFKVKTKKQSADFTTDDSKTVFESSIGITNDETIASLVNKIQKGSYQALFLKVDSFKSELNIISDIITGLRTHKLLILAPEINQIQQLTAELTKVFGSRLAVITSKMKTRQKGRAINSILSGCSDIVLGTRSAVFAPLDDISLIIIMSEHSSSYKAEEGIRYNARDVAVMRGYISNCPVLLTSYVPSIETYLNLKLGKYKEIDSIQSGKNKCKVVELKTDFKKKLSNSIADEVVEFIRNILNKGGSFAIFAQSEGSSLIYCKDCGKVMRCSKCDAALTVYDETNTFSCNRCNYTTQLPNTCSYCEGMNLTRLGIGLQKVKKEMEKLLHNHNLYDFSLDLLNSVIVSKGIRLKNGNLDGAAILDFDYLLTRYGFRANERIFQDVMRLKGLIKKDGILFIETSGYNPILIKSLKDDDYKRLYETELKSRLTAFYPPFCKMVSICIDAKENNLNALLNELENIKSNRKFELLGYTVIKSEKKRFDYRVRFTLRSKEKRILNDVVLKINIICQNIKGLHLSIDVDPYML
ncbi:MAG: hypothetical protein N3A62_08525 [Thermodesulfovibrionales bacterium]|nr:hypothetical protein [Thermodesulfovibrionales bacterium]